MAELEKKQKEVGLNKEDNGSSDFSKKTKKGLFSILTNHVNKKLNPERYFEEVLEEGEFEQLKILVKDSRGKISWKELVKEGIVKIENRKVEGIYWKGDLDLSNLRVKILRKFKIIKGYLSCKGAESLEDLGELEEVWGYLDIRGTKIKTLGKLKIVGEHILCKGLKTLENLGEIEEVWWPLDIRGTKIKTLGKLKKVRNTLNCKGAESLQDLGELEEVWGTLDIRGTKIKTLGKLKRVRNTLNCKGLKTLENLGELEEVWGTLDIRGTKIKTLGKLKRVLETLYCNGLRNIEKFGNLKEVLGVLCILDTPYKFQAGLVKEINKGKILYERNSSGKNIRKGTCLLGGDKKGIEELLEQKKIPGTLSLFDLQVDMQIKISDMIGNRQLKVENEVSFGGSTEGVNKLLEQKKINGKLNLRKAPICMQIEALYKINITKELRVEYLFIEDRIEERFRELDSSEDRKLNIEAFQEKFGRDIKEIEDEETRKLAVKILELEYKRIKKELNKKIEEIKKETDVENITEEEKIKLKEQVAELINQFKTEKAKLENFGIEFD